MNRNLKTFYFIVIFILSQFVMTGQNKESNSEISTVDLNKEKLVIDSIVSQFSMDFLFGDSIALANYYSKDGRFGSAKGDEIISAWGKIIRKSIKNNARTVKYTIISLTGDEEYLIDYGIFEMRDIYNINSKGKYLVVWKNENGHWKMYRDDGL